MKLLAYILVMAIGTAECHAQQTGVVVDMETGVPIRDVKVIVDGDYNKTLITDYQGTYAVPTGYRCLTLMREGYERRIVNMEEWTDTLSLLPAYNRLHEVVVLGDKSKAFRGFLDPIRREAAIAGVGSKGGFDFFSIFSVFNKNHVSAKKRRERMKAIENY